MGQILMWIVVIVVFALIVASWEEQQKQRKAIEDLRRAKDDFLKAVFRRPARRGVFSGARSGR